MKYYLSSYKFGTEFEKLKTLINQGARIGHINNAKDSDNDKISKKRLEEEMEFLDSLGFQNEHLDLKKYFWKENELRKKLNELDGIWLTGGNTFVLRQAMRISDFDTIFPELQKRKDFLWGGYSAGVCVLCDSLKYIDITDDPNEFPYHELKTPIYEGLCKFNYGILPHYNSNRLEAELISQQVQRAIENRWLFKIMKDGEVIITEDE